MAMFDGTVGAYTTPDGRVVQMPAGLASSFPALRPVGPPPPGAPAPGLAPDPGLGGPAAAPDPMTPLPIPGGGNPQWTATDATDLAKATADAKAAQSSGSTLNGPVVAPPPSGRAPGKGSKPSAPPPDQPGSPGAIDQSLQGERPITNADFAKMGEAGPANAAIAASNEKKRAIAEQSDAMVDQARQVGEAQTAAADDAQRRLEAEAQEAQRRQAGLDAHTADLQAQAKKIADTRIDHTADHPIIAAIGVALATLGTAMQNRDAALAAAFAGRPAPAPIENPGLKAMYMAIDRKVAEQMQQLDIQKTAFSASSQALDAERGAMNTKLTQMAALRIGYLEQAKQRIAAVTATSSVPVVKANGALAIADASREQAETLGAEQGRWQAHDDQVKARQQAAAQHAQSIALQREQMHQQYQMHRETLAVTQQDKMAELAERALVAGDKATADRAKAVQERAVGDPRTGFAILNPIGVAKMKQADQAEAQARQQQDPATAQRLRSYAEQLRTSAQLNDSALAPTAEAQKELTKQVTAAQDITDRIGDTIAKLEAGPGVLNREAWSSITTDLGNIAGKYQQAMGERVSTKAFEQTMQHILSFDPDSLFQRAASKGKALESLRTLKGMIASDVNGALKANRIQTDWTPIAKGEEGGAANFNADEKTAAEIGQDDDPGILARAGARIATLGTKSYGDLFPEEQDAAANAARAQPGAEAGLSPNATTHIKSLAARALTAGDAEHDRIVTALANPISAGLNVGGRNSLAMGMLEVLRNTAPAVYEDVVKALPASDQKEIRGLEATIRKTVNVPSVPSNYDPDAAAAAQAERDKAAAAQSKRAAEILAAQRDKFGDMGAAR